MIDWTARADAVLRKTARPHTAKTDENPIPSASSVATEGLSEKSRRGFVGSVGTLPEVLPDHAVLAAHRWRLDFGDAGTLEVTFAPAVGQVEALSRYPDALAAEPMQDLPAVAVPPDLAAMFDACMTAGLYDEADRFALPAMLALDAEGTRGLIEAVHSRIGRCRRCRHFRRPGLSDGYCTERSDLEHVYGFMRRLPDDRGAACEAFEATRSRTTHPGSPRRRL